MNVGLVLVIVGLVALGCAWAFRALFVDTSDEHNPNRRMNVALGIAGAVAAAWGVVLLLFVGD